MKKATKTLYDKLKTDKQRIVFLLELLDITEKENEVLLDAVDSEIRGRAP